MCFAEVRLPERHQKGNFAMTTMPAFVFLRRRDIELEAGFTLAGQLIVDIPKTKKLKKHERQMIKGYIQRLTADIPRMPPDDAAVVFGWHGGVRPPDAADTKNDEIMGAWCDRSVAIAVRIVSARTVADEQGTRH
jgi:hypothetical protein